jgi:hypothetical protein
MGNFILTIINRIRPVVPANRIEYDGFIHTVAVIDLREGVTVVTPDGIGTIISIIPDWVTKKPQYAEVLLYRGYAKRYRVLLLQQYVVNHVKSFQFHKLTPSNYIYVYKQKQAVTYRITNRQYAQMSDKSKKEYQYAKTLNKTSKGLRFLRILVNQNLEIHKQPIKKNK